MSQKCRKNMVNYYKRENKNGTSYQATIRIKGYSVIRKTFKKKSDAQSWAEPIEIAMKKGSYKEYEQNNYNIETVAQLIDHFDQNVAKLRYSHYEKYSALFLWWKKHIGNVKIRELSTSMLTSCKNILINEKIHKGKTETKRKANTINKYLMCMSAVLTYATNELEIIDINPMSKVKTLKKPNGRVKFLSDNQIQTLAQKCKEYSPKVFLFFMLLLKTGGRYDEVRHLQVKDIDRQNNRVYFLDTKNGTHRGVHIDKYTIELIDAYLKENKIESGYLFVAARKDGQLAYLKGTLENIIASAGLEDFHIHDIRHTTASILAKNGASLLEIAEILGQKSLTVAKIYSHLTKKHTEDLLASVMDSYQF